MDTRTGRIFSPEVMGELDKEIAEGLSADNLADSKALEKALFGIPKNEYPKARDNLVAMIAPPTKEQLESGKVGRNDPCPCNSGKKFKKCCYISAKNKEY
jgi:uncharacterized protein YecA (UPF0149 family)